MPGQPGPGREHEATLLLGIDHLHGVAEAVASLCLDLAEDEAPSAPHDEIQLVAADPGVAREHTVAAQPIPPCRASLGVPATVHGGNATPSGRARPLRIRNGTQDAEAVTVDRDQRSPVWPANDEVTVAVPPQAIVPDVLRLVLPRHVDA